MYSGILSQYTIEPRTNKLENIYLTNARKWKLVENKDSGDIEMKPVEFKSDCLILDYKDVFNINLNYIYKEKSKASLYLPILFLFTTLFVILSKSKWLYSESLFFTITTKISAAIFSLWLFVLIEFLFTRSTKKEEKNSAIWGTITLALIHMAIHFLLVMIF